MFRIVYCIVLYCLCKISVRFSPSSFFFFFRGEGGGGYVGEGGALCVLILFQTAGIFIIYFF